MLGPAGTELPGLGKNTQRGAYCHHRGQHRSSRATIHAVHNGETPARANSTRADPQRRHRNGKYVLPIQTLLVEAPQIRVRNLSHRQMEQLGELVVANERLAGRPVSKARQRVEFLKRRREVWEMIYNRVTKQDASATLAALEEAHKEVAKAVSERSRERKGVGELKRQLVQLQAQVAAAHQQLHHTQELVQLNRERIQQLTLETQSAECQSEPIPPAAAQSQAAASRLSATATAAAAAQREENPWAAVAFPEAVREGSMTVIQHAGKHWVLFRDASGAAACIEDCCAHRACPLSLGKMTDGQPTCAYHGWKYNASGLCTEMPSTVMCAGIRVASLACAEVGGLVWVAEPMAALQNPDPSRLSPPPQGLTPVSKAQVEVAVEESVLREALLQGPPLFANPSCSPAWLCTAAKLLLGADDCSSYEEQPGYLIRSLGSSIEERHLLVSAGPGKCRWLYQLSIRRSHWAASALPGRAWQHLTQRAAAAFSSQFERQEMKEAEVASA